eukprot:9365176-Alexandrium_andersonii.AAC.1
MKDGRGIIAFPNALLYCYNLCIIVIGRFLSITTLLIFSHAAFHPDVVCVQRRQYHIQTRVILALTSKWPAYSPIASC